MNRTLINIYKAIKPESCARMRKRLRETNRDLFEKHILTTNIYQAMGKL